MLGPLNAITFKSRVPFQPSIAQQKRLPQTMQSLIKCPLWHYHIYTQPNNLIDSAMDFDDLDRILDDTAYIPSFAPRQPKRKDSAKEKQTPLDLSQSSKNDGNSSQTFGMGKPQVGGLLTAHKETTKKSAITFEDVLRRDQQTEKNNYANRNKMGGWPNDNQSDNKSEDIGFRINSQRTGNMRLRPSMGKQSQQYIEKPIEIQTNFPKTNPTLNLKKTSSKNQSTSQPSQTYSYALLHHQKQKNGNDFDPLQNLSHDEHRQAKKLFEQQMELQRRMYNKLIEQQRLNKKQQIQAIKKMHLDELTKKLQLKNYQILKLKQFFQLQLNAKTNLNIEHKQVIAAQSKIQENLRQLHKIQAKINDQYQQFQQKQISDYNADMDKKSSLLERRERALQQLQSRLQQQQKDIYMQKQRIYKQQNIQRNKINELTIQLNLRQQQLQHKYQRKLKQLQDEFNKKKVQFDQQKNITKYQTLQLQQKKIQIQTQQQNVINKIKDFDERQRSTMDSLHSQKTKLMEKQIQVNTKMADLSLRETELQMGRQQLVNKMKILELERKKLEVEAKGALKPQGKQTLMREMAATGVLKEHATLTAGNFEQYQRSISQMREEMMRLMPTF